MNSFQQWLAEASGDPWLLCALLFVGPFVLEEAALIGGAFLAAADELSVAAALGSLYAGLVVSDWCVYYLGYLAGRTAWGRRLVGEQTIARGQRYLGDRLTLALLAGRLVPWLQFPIFVGCGFVGVGFRRFALINLGLGLVYAVAVFAAALFLGELTFEYLHSWGWLILALIAIAAALVHRHFARRQDKG